MHACAIDRAGRPAHDALRLLARPGRRLKMEPSDDPGSRAPLDMDSNTAIDYG
eukprot:COSAG01_NODE_63789_length_278_cov_3.206704_2_plen_52_part_01